MITGMLVGGFLVLIGVSFGRVYERNAQAREIRTGAAVGEKILANVRDAHNRANAAAYAAEHRR